jgi:hypothetical protein
MKKFLLLLAMVCILAPVGMATAASTTTTFGTFISSIFGKKEKPQPKFRPMPKSVFKIK